MRNLAITLNYSSGICASEAVDLAFFITVSMWVQGFPEILNEGLTQLFLSLGLWDGSFLPLLGVLWFKREEVSRRCASIDRVWCVSICFFWQCNPFSGVVISHQTFSSNCDWPSLKLAELDHCLSTPSINLCRPESVISAYLGSSWKILLRVSIRLQVERNFITHPYFTVTTVN